MLVVWLKLSKCVSAMYTIGFNICVLVFQFEAKNVCSRRILSLLFVLGRHLLTSAFHHCLPLFRFQVLFINKHIVSFIHSNRNYSANSALSAIVQCSDVAHSPTCSDCYTL